MAVPEPSRPLAGIRVVDLSTMVAGPLATSILADQGADVIKVERPGVGDPIRHLGDARSGASAIFQALNRAKRSVVLDLKDERGHALLRQLVGRADVFVQNYRPGVADRMGLGEDALRAIRGDLVYVSITGFGDEGPHAQRRVYDIVVQALSGMAASQAPSPDERPRLVRTIVCDKITAVHAAQAISAALLARERGGGGTHVRLSLLDASVAFLWPDMMQGVSYLGGEDTTGPSLHGVIRVHETRDGHVTFLALTDDDFRGACRALGRPELAEDERFRERTPRLEHAAELAEIVEEATRGFATAELCDRFANEDVPCGEVNPVDRVHADPQVVANRLVQELEDERYGRVRLPGPVVRFGPGRAPLAGLAPSLGEHGPAVLTELGLGTAEIDTLRDDGVLG